MLPHRCVWAAIAATGLAPLPAQATPAPLPVLAPAAAAATDGARAAGALAARRWLVHLAGKLDRQGLRAAIRAGDPAEVARQIEWLQLRAQAAAAPLEAAVGRLGGSVDAVFWLIDAAAVTLPDARADELARLPQVVRVEPDRVELPGMGRATNRLNHGAQSVHALGYLGQGVTIAVLDTGQDQTMGGSGRPHRIYFPGGDPANLTGGGIGGSRLLRNAQLGLLPADNGLGHGPAVAAVAAGAPWGAPGAFAGHAPAARIAGYGIADLTGGGAWDATIIRALQAVVADRTALGIEVVNLSYGGSPDPTSAVQQALDSTAALADLLVTVCAFNTGSAGTASSQSACNGIAVGAVTLDRHGVTDYSARGPLQGDPSRTYPDLAAVASTIGPFPDCENDAGPWYGTSFAAPQVAGAAALVRQAAPALSALETKAILLASALDLAADNPELLTETQRRNAFGAGLLRDDVAVATALDPARHQTLALQPGASLLVPIPVTAGEPTGVAITWFRSQYAVASWSDVDLRILDGATVVAASGSPRNLYEQVRFTPAHSGTMLAELRPVLLVAPLEPVALAVASLASVPLAATYTSFGAPCAGGASRAGSIVQASNGSAVAGDVRADIFQLSSSDWVFAFTAPPSGFTVRGFELLLALADGPVAVPTFLHLDQGGLPAGAPAATGTMLPGAQPGWFGTTFANPVAVAGGSTYYVGFRPVGPARVSLLLRQGTPVNGFCRLACGGAFRAAGSAPVGLRVLGGAPATGTEPQLGSVGGPDLGGTYLAILSQARPLAVTALATGFSRQSYHGTPLPLPFAPFGGGSCQLLVAPDGLALGLTDAAGLGACAMAVPNLAALRGGVYYQQYFVLDPGANALGIAATHGAIARIGDGP